MFKCDQCGESAKPGKAPTFVVVKSEPLEYLNRDADKNPVLTVGYQTVQEAKLCPPCAGIEDREGSDEGMIVNLRGAKASEGHLERCNKNLGDCKICDQIRKFFALLPLHHLSHCLAEPPTIPATFSMGTLILDSWIVRNGDKPCRRQQRDIEFCGAFLKRYENEGGKIGAH